MITHVAIAPYRERKLIDRHRHPTLPLTLYDYSKRCQYDRAWDEVTLACRGLVLDDDDRVVIRPLGKFFNWNEPDAVMPAGPATVFEKLDGSLVNVARWHDEMIVATRLRFDNDHVRYARAILARRHPGFVPEPGWTYAFELIHPATRIVVDNGEREDLVLLAKIETATGREQAIHEAIEWTGARAAQYPFASIAELQGRGDPGERFEGFVLRWESGYRVKVKLEDYLRVHRIVTGVTDKVIWEHLRAGHTLEELLLNVPEEFQVWAGDSAETILSRVVASRAEAERRLEAVRALPRASWHTTLVGDGYDAPELVFFLADGKGAKLHRSLWEMARPTRSTNPFLSRDAG